MTTDYNPFAERQIKHPTTDFETLIHLCKASLGTGLLSMPIAFSNLGLWLGIPGTLLVGIMSTHCVHMLVKCSQTLCFRCQVPRLNYAETAERAFLKDPRLGVTMRCIVNFFLITNFLGAICIYLIIGAATMTQILEAHMPGDKVTLRLWILILTVPVLFLCLIRDLKYLVPFSFLANALMFGGITITLVFIFIDLPSTDARPAITPFVKWPDFFGTSIFVLENIGIVLPCENEMKTPKHFIGCPSVLVIAMTIVTALYTSLGFFGFLKYGDETKANITLNLPDDNAWAEVAKVLVAAAMYFTIFLALYVPINIMWNGLKERIPKRKKFSAECILRVSIIILCTAVAVVFSDLGPFISLVGAVVLSTLGFILPAILDIVVFRIEPECGVLDFHLIKDVFIILFGILLLVTGSIVSINGFTT